MRQIQIQLPDANRENVLIFFDVIKLVLIIILMGAFVNFNVKLAQEVRATKDIAIKQTQLVKTQQKEIEVLNVNTDSIHSQINCVLNFFAQSPAARTNSNIASPNPCIIK